MTANHQLSYVKCAGNTTYTISKKAGKSFRIATTEEKPEIGVSWLQTMANHTGTSLTITTDAKAKYLAFVCFSTGDGDSGSYLDMYETVMVEKGLVATDYEKYIEKIFIKNDNDFYEEFRKKEEINITTGVEFETGRIIDGKKEYGKRIDCGNLPNASAKNISHGLSNVKFVGFNGMATDGYNTVILPAIAITSFNPFITVNIDIYNIIITTGIDRSSYTATVTLYYIKN